jgi:tRNA(Ile)-lysidine synthase
MSRLLDIGLEARVSRFVAEKGLFDGVSRLGLAVSGGSDSLSLLHLIAPLCRRAGIVPVVLNFDHAIPGEHSDVDAAFVRDDASRLGLEFFGEVADGIVSGGGKSLEMAAREARQAFYRRAADHLELDAVATGHQADDVAETLLIRLLRGAGASGLAGLRPRTILPPQATNGNKPLVIIRPLLEIRREELRGWLRERGLGWCEDPSNSNEAIPRNEVRRSMLPALARRGFGLEETVRQLARSADILREEDDYLDGIAAKWLDAVMGGPGIVRASSDVRDLPVERLRAEQPLAICRRVVRMWLLSHFGGEAAGFASVETVLELGDGDVTTLPGGWRVTRESGLMGVLPEKGNHAVLSEICLAVPGEVQWGCYKITASFGGSVERSRQGIGVWPASCTVSALRLHGKTLTVRGRRPGDRMAPYGLGGTRKLQDIFIDAKLPEAERDAYPVVACGDEIVWVPGYRIGAQYAVRDGEECLRLVVSSSD